MRVAVFPLVALASWQQCNDTRFKHAGLALFCFPSDGVYTLTVFRLGETRCLLSYCLYGSFPAARSDKPTKGVASVEIPRLHNAGNKKQKTND